MNGRGDRSRPGPRGGLGWSLGVALRQWLDNEAEPPQNSRLLTNRLLDGLGADDTLVGPIRDLSSRPQLLQALCGDGATRQAAVLTLSQQLARTYTPAVLGQLLDLLEAGSGIAIPRESLAAEAGAGGRAGAAPLRRPRPQGWLALLQAIAPGVLLTLGATLVISWLGHELGRILVERWHWSSAVVLTLLIGALQAMTLGPLKGLRRLWSLSDEQAIQAREAWRWTGCCWLHNNGIEAAIHLLLVLLLQGGSTLPLGQMAGGYGLIALACLVPAVLVAEWSDVPRRWSGASGPVSVLIGLEAGRSLLAWRVLELDTPLIGIPVWVLLLSYGAMQLSWCLPRRPGDPGSRSWQRLLGSPCSWGLLLGLLWAVVSRLQQLLGS